ncbi:MAG: hypothetical protein ACYC2K_09550 [Gemmatimonadales bacterium]
MVVTGRRGASTTGCLFSLLVTAVVVYYGLNLGQVWWRYYELLDRMKSAARFANVNTDAQILSQLQGDAAELSIPGSPLRFRVVRTQNPNAISISTSYTEQVELPFVHRTLSFKPSVNQRL